MKKHIVACGKLDYSDYAQFEIINYTSATNISKILDKVYYSNNNKINIRIMSGSKTLFNEDGNLLMKKDKHGIYSYHVNGECLELVLFNNVNQFIDIEIVADVAEMGEITYGQHTYESKQCAK